MSKLKHVPNVVFSFVILNNEDNPYLMERYHEVLTNSGKKFVVPITQINKHSESVEVIRHKLHNMIDTAFDCYVSK